MESIVSRILIELDDAESRKYYLKALNSAFNTFRTINVNISSTYLERKVTLNEINAFDTPKESVKIAAVGVYRNGEFFGFTQKPNMSLMPVDYEDGIHEDDDTENLSIVHPGGKFGKGVKNIGYWREDSENCRVFVRNFRTIDKAIEDVTSNIKTKVIVRFKTDGLNCSSECIVPSNMEDLIAANVVYEFAMKNIPFRMTADEKDRYERKLAAAQDSYEALEYENFSFWDIEDAINGSSNTTARR
jgi:hypothetical protein